MSLAESVPGMKSESTGRNVAVGAVYLFTVPLWAIFLPFIAAIAVSLNYGGIAERLTAVPGIGPEGGAIAGVATFMYVTVIFLVLSAAAPDSASEGGPADVEPTETTPPAAASPTDGGTQAGGVTPTAGRATTSPTDAPPADATATVAATATAITAATATEAADTGQQTSWTVEVVRIIDGDTLYRVR